MRTDEPCTPGDEIGSHRRPRSSEPEGPKRPGDAGFVATHRTPRRPWRRLGKLAAKPAWDRLWIRKEIIASEQARPFNVVMAGAGLIGVRIAGRRHAAAMAVSGDRAATGALIS